MGLLDFLNLKLRNKARDAPMATVFRRAKSLTGIARTHADITMQANEAIYAAVSRIANTVSSMPCHLMRQHDIDATHPLDRLVSLRPNDNMSAFVFFQTMEVCRNLEGMGYALIRRDGLGMPQQLDILDPTRVRAARHPETHDMWYIVTMDDGKQYPLPGSEVLVVKHMSSNGESGIRPVDVLRDTLLYDKQTKQFSTDQLGGINNGIFLTVPNTGLGKEARDAVVDQFIEAYDRSGGRVVILEGGLTATPFNNSPINAQVLDVERITRNRVATVYNIPPHLLGDYTDASFSTLEQQMQEFITLTILPIVRQWEQELNRKLLLPQDIENGYSFRFEMDELLRADAASRANAHQMAIRGGWMTPNEVRRREDLPPDPIGDKLMSSRDLIPLEVAVNHAEVLLGTEKIDHRDD